MSNLTIDGRPATITEIDEVVSALGSAWDHFVDPSAVLAEYRFGSAPDVAKYPGKTIDISALATLQARSDLKPMEGGYDGSTPIGTGSTRINSQCGTVAPNFTAASHDFAANANGLRLKQTCAAGSGEWGLLTMGDYAYGAAASVTINARGGTTETPKASLGLSDAQLALINVGQACNVVDQDYGMCRVAAKSANGITIEQVQASSNPAPAIPRTLSSGNGFSVDFFRDVYIVPVTAWTDGATTCTIPTSYASLIKAGMQCAAMKSLVDELISFGTERVQSVNTSTGVITFTAPKSLFSQAPTPSSGYLVFMPDLTEPQLWTYRDDWSLYAGATKAIAYRGVVTLAPRANRSDCLRGVYTRAQKQALIDRGGMKPIWQQPGWMFPYQPGSAAAPLPGAGTGTMEYDFENFDHLPEGPNVITLNPHFSSGGAVTRIAVNHADAVWLPDGADQNIATPNARRLMFFRAIGGRKLDYAKVIYEHGQVIHIIDGRVRAIDITHDLSNFDWRPQQVGYVPCAGSFAGWYGRNLFFPLSNAQVNNDNWMDVHSITLAAW